MLSVLLQARPMSHEVSHTAVQLIVCFHWAMYVGLISGKPPSGLLLPKHSLGAGSQGLVLLFLNSYWCFSPSYCIALLPYRKMTLISFFFNITARPFLFVKHLRSLHNMVCSTCILCASCEVLMLSEASQTEGNTDICESKALILPKMWFPWQDTVTLC